MPVANVTARGASRSTEWWALTCTSTSLRPESGVYYVHRGTEFTLASFVEVLQEERLVQAFFNSALISTLATVFSLLVTVSSGYMLSRFKGLASSTWFGTIYVFRCVPYISWVLPLYFVAQSWGLYDTYLGLLLPHIAVHICFFSWLMKGFFDGVFLGDPEFPELNEALQRIAARYSVTDTAIAVGWITRHPANIQVVLGTTTPQRVRDSAAGSEIPLTRTEWYELFRLAGHIVP